jgi:hypothetical protein
MVVSVAFDVGGAAAVREWIRPAEPIDIPHRFQDIMGWSAEQYRRAAAPTYPCLIDEQHVVAELYNMPNVPMAVWIAEDGRIVRPAEPAGATDGFRKMDRATFSMPADVVAEGKAARKRYVDALRDWVEHGDASPFALAPDEVRRRAAGPSETEVLAAANFRLGQYLHQRGQVESAKRYFEEAARLCPEHWHYFRQALELEAKGKASGPEFAAAVKALGERSYYPPIVLEPTTP